MTMNNVNHFPIELMVISKCMQERSLHEPVSRGIDSEWFPIYRYVWQYLLEYQNEYSGLPSIYTLKMKFEGLQLKKVEDPWDYLVSELRKRNISNAIQNIAMQCEEAIEMREDKIDEEFSRIRDAIMDNTIKYVLSRDASYKKYDDRLSETAEKVRYFKQHKKANVIEVGLEDIDEGVPFTRGHLTTIQAQTGNYKSFFALRLAAYARALNNCVVGVVSLEMGANEVAYRIDAIEATRRGYRLSNKKLLRGVKGSSVLSIKEYETFLKEVHDDKIKDIVIATNEHVSGSFTTATFAAKIDEWHTKYGDDLAVVVLDYVTLLDDANDWVDIKKVTRQLKKIAQRYNIALISLAQSKRGKKGDMLDTDDIGFGISIMQDSDNILSLSSTYQEIDGTNTRLLKCKCNKNRHGEEEWYFTMKLDPDYGNFEVIEKSGVAFHETEKDDTELMVAEMVYEDNESAADKIMGK